MSAPHERRRVYTIEEVAALLGLSRNSAYVAAREGQLPVPIIRIGKRMMVSCAAFDRFLETGDDTERGRRRRLTIAARELIALSQRYPELFKHVLPICDEDMETLRELAAGDEENADAE